ncbi:MAG: hypothetical protein HZA54_15525 [Planctomycetes bacterium]|nr:hypothetical protein [Planctomycetota bacterium]
MSDPVSSSASAGAPGSPIVSPSGATAPPPPPAAEISFDRAEPRRAEGPGGAAGAAAACAVCRRPLTDEYYACGDKTVCPGCRIGVLQALTGGSTAWRLARASVAGLGAAAVGAGIYFAISALTGYEFGLIAVVVGMMVGGAVRWGSQGRGGWQFQVLAIFLTYGAIVSTYVPLILKSIRERPPQAAPAPPAAQPGAVGQETDDTRAAPRGPLEAVLSLLLAFALLFAIAFAAPILAGFENFIGWIIIGFALYEAWRMTRRVEITFTGPYRIGSPGAPAAIGGADSGG